MILWFEENGVLIPSSCANTPLLFAEECADVITWNLVISLFVDVNAISDVDL